VGPIYIPLDLLSLYVDSMSFTLLLSDIVLYFSIGSPVHSVWVYTLNCRALCVAAGKVNIETVAWWLLSDVDQILALFLKM
jgi:hypothetical protein